MILPNDSLQIVVVTTPHWDHFEGNLQLFARDTISASWRAVSAPEEVVVGRNGLGWRGDRSLSGLEGPVKQEGDGKAPAGIFDLSLVFGEAPTPPFLKMPYLQTKGSLLCIDDVHSKQYNRLVDSSQLTELEKDWKSYERMKRTDALYRWGMVVNHNSSPTFPGQGSCIFLHLWSDSSTPTAGCTAMSLSVMEKLLTWLDFAQKPILVQLPDSEFTKINAMFDFAESIEKSSFSRKRESTTSSFGYPLSWV